MRKLITICLISMILTAASSPVMAYYNSHSDWLAVVNNGADYLMTYENNDGGHPWHLTETQRNNFDGSGTTPNNTIGATARGLVAAYNVTGNTNYLNAANRAANLIETRYDNDTTIGSYRAPFYSKDVEFAYELADAGGTDITSKANASAVSYFNDKLNDYSGNASITNAAEAVNQAYNDSGIDDYLRLWNLGNWTHVGSLLGDTEIETGYTGNDFASDLYSLIASDVSTLGPTNVDSLGLAGVLEAAYAANGDAGNTGALDIIKARLADTENFGFGYQDIAYTAYSLGLLDDPAAIDASDILVSWQNDDGSYLYGTDWYGEIQGEVLLGMAGNPVPEPATIAILGLGGLALIRRKRRA